MAYMDSLFALILSLCHNSNFSKKHSTYYDLERRILHKKATPIGYERLATLSACYDCADYDSYNDAEDMPPTNCNRCGGTGWEEVIWQGQYYQRWEWRGFVFKKFTENPQGQLIFPSSPFSEPMGNISNMPFHILLLRYYPVYFWDACKYQLKLSRKSVIYRLKSKREKQDNCPL